MQILLLEDDPIIVQAVASDLKAEGYRVTACRTVAEARRALATGRFELLLFDVNLPDGTSFDLCREAVRESPGLPILVLTASTDEGTAVKSLSLGAVDFIRKPFSRRELLLRIRNCLRGRQGTLELGELKLSIDTHEATFADRAFSVTRKEWDILATLLRRPGDAVQREAILQAVDPDGAMEERTLNSHISRLRTKLAKASGGRVRIEPVYGVGYRLERGEKGRKASGE